MEGRRTSYSDWMIPLVFLVLGAFGVLTHEFWRDEAGPWLIIRSSHSIREMIANMGYTGHTLTFYVWQYFLFKFFHTPLAGSIANLLFMTAAIAMFVKTSPFSPSQKWLFAIGFFPLYQYAVFNRMYAFLVFFQFAYCALYMAYPRRTLLRWFMLILMTETHMLGMLAAIPLAVLDIARTWGFEKKTKLETAFYGFKILFFIFALASVVWQLWPADQNYHSLHPDKPILAFIGFANAFLPNFGIFYQSHFQIVAGILLWLIALIALWRHRGALTTFIMLALPLALFSAIMYSGHRWHHGFYWIYWVMSLWLSGVAWQTDTRLRRLVTVLFALHAAMGVYALTIDGLHPYSSGKDVARHIQENGMTQLPMVGAEVFQDSHDGIVYKWEVDQIQPTLLALKDARIFDPRARQWITNWNHYDNRLYFSRRSLAEFEADLKDIAKEIGAPFLLIVATNEGLPEPQMPPNLTLLYRANPAIDYGEHLSLYRFSDR